MTRYCTFLGFAILSPMMTLAAQRIEQRAAAASDAVVEISNVSGSIAVSSWNRNEVEVTGSMGDQSTLEFNGDPSRLSIKVIRPKFFSWSYDESATLNVHVPARGRVVVAAVSADTSVQGVQGALKLQSVSGGITAEAWNEDLEAKTVSGDVTINGHQGNAVFALSTVSGNLKVRGIGGEVNVSTVSGDANVKAGSISRGRLRSTSGDLTFQAELTKDARLETDSVSGDVELVLHGTRDADYELRTFSGDIDNCFGPAAASRSKHSHGKELNFSEGGGSARVRVKTLSGDLRLCDR